MTCCETCEVSYAQERIWNLTRPDPSTVNYNLPVALQLVGPLDRAALERAFNDAVRRHESLRTVFREVDGHVQQVILPQLEIPLVTESAPADDPEAFLRR